MNWAEAYLYSVIDSSSVSGAVTASRPIWSVDMERGTTGPEGVCMPYSPTSSRRGLWLVCGRIERIRQLSRVDASGERGMIVALSERLGPE